MGISGLAQCYQKILVALFSIKRLKKLGVIWSSLGPKITTSNDRVMPSIGLVDRYQKYKFYLQCGVCFMHVSFSVSVITATSRWNYLVLLTFGFNQ